MLEVEKWNELIEEMLKNPEDQAGLISGLTKAREEYVSGYAEFASLQDAHKKLNEEVERLRQTNMDLYLRIGRDLETTKIESSKPKDDESLTIKIADVVTAALKED